MSYTTDQIAEMRKQIADLKAGQVTYIKVPVVSVDKENSTFDVGIESGDGGGIVVLPGLDAPKQHLPAPGSDATLALIGGQPVFQVGEIAEGSIGDTELSPEVTQAIADSKDRSETAIGQAEAANAAATQAANAALAADGAALDASAAATLSAQRAEAARLAAEAAEATSGEVTGSVLAAQEAADQANDAAQAALGQATAAGATVTSAQQAATAAQNAATAANDAAGVAGTAAAAADAKAAQAAADAAKAAADALLAKQQAEAARQAATDAATSAGQAVTVAQTAANGKNSIFYSLNVAPTTGNTGRVNGDTWFRRDANGVIIGHWEWVVPTSGTAAWVSRTVGSQVIANLDVGKLTSGTIAAGQKISAGPLLGTHAEMTDTGFRVYSEDPVDNIPNEVVRMGTDTNDFIGVVGANGDLLASIDDTGRVSASEVNTDRIYLAGRNLATDLAANHKVVGRFRGQLGFNQPKVYVEPYGIAEVGAALVAGRTYRIDYRFGYWPETGGDEFLVHMIYSMGAAGDTTTEAPAIVAKTAVDNSSIGKWYTTQSITNRLTEVQGLGTFTPTRTTRYRIGIALQRTSVGSTFGTATIANQIVELIVTDLGPATPMSGGMTNMGGTLLNPPAPPPPPPASVTQSYYVDLAPAGRASYNGSGQLMTWVGNDVYQGYHSSNGDTSGQFYFNLPNITGTIDGVTVWAYFRHWYYNSGGTVRFGMTDQRAQFTRHSFQPIYESTGWPKPGGREVFLPAQWWPYFRGTNNFALNGRATVITLGPGGGTNPLFYGVCTDMRLRIAYTQ